MPFVGDHFTTVSVLPEAVDGLLALEADLTAD
jgi:hypothetical protein